MTTPEKSPAFPTTLTGKWVGIGKDAVFSPDCAAGMTLHDYFAAHAPPVPDWWDSMAAANLGNESWGMMRLKTWRWAYADNMLSESAERAERAKRKEKREHRIYKV